MYEFLSSAKRGYLDLVDGWLSYNISRKYPFDAKIKKGVFVGCCLLLLVLTVFNFATNGFDMQTTYSTDANSTQATKHWYRHKIFTWGDDKLDPTCQYLEVPVGYQLMTSNLGLRYTVTGIVYHHETGKQEKRSSISYLNNTLTNCQVDSVNIYLRKADTLYPWQPAQDWWTWVDSFADAVAHCNVNNDEGLFTIQFTTTYQTEATHFNYIPVNTLYSYVAMDDFTTHGSVWWGTRMLTNYFVGIQYLMAGTALDTADDIPYARAAISFHSTNNTSITKNNIFDLGYHFMAANRLVFNSDDYSADASIMYNNQNFVLSRVLTECLGFAKVLHSLVLVDLGNSQAPNLLLDENLLQYALNATDDFNRHIGPLADTSAPNEWKFARLSPPDQASQMKHTSVAMNQAYSEFKDKYHMGDLSTHEATIYAQYICSVPQKKSNGTIALFILVANFALFQTAWTIFKFFADLAAAKSHTAMYCEGCLSHDYGLATMEDGVNEPLPPRPAKRGDRTYSSSSSMKGLLKDQHLDDENKFE